MGRGEQKKQMPVYNVQDKPTSVKVLNYEKFTVRLL